MTGGDLVTSASSALFGQLEDLLPGANTRTTTHYDPLPLALDHGDGYRVWDVDGNQYVDLLNNYTAFVHGHAHPQITEAIIAALHRGTGFPAPIALHAALAERIRARFESIELLRFTNSGSEAVMMAVRAARAFTGRDEIVVAAGSYHGSWDQVSEIPEDAQAPALAPPGVPEVVSSLVHLVAHNDPDDLRRLMTERGDRVAAVLLEPVLGHVIEPTVRPFLAAARELADRHGALLILDEVVTARLDAGGLQRAMAIDPDLTTLGKIIGGGLPVGAFGGRADVMSTFDPRRADRIEHHGTFNGNPLTMAAGCASLDLLPQGEIDRINALGDRLAQGARAAAAAAELPLEVSSCGSLINYRGSVPLLQRVHRAALGQGLYMAPRGLMNVSTPMTEGVIDAVIETLGRTLQIVREESESVS
jgi:glutamate-1-semialdehyde 2,1-aminomutase